MALVNRAGPHCVALETTVLVHGVPLGEGAPLARELGQIVRSRGAQPAIVGIIAGQPVVGLSDEELATMLEAPAPVAKVNTANLGLALARGQHAATTVSATMELCAATGVRIFATGGIGGVHRGYGTRLDVSSDLAALARFPVAVVASGVKSILDVEATREALETLGVPVVGFGTSRFPAFYLRETDVPVDGRFDDVPELAVYIRQELERTRRGILVVNPIPEGDAIPQDRWETWLAEAEAHAAEAGITGRDVTPAILGHLHGISGGVTLRANLALLRNNADLAARLCRAMQSAGE